MNLLPILFSFLAYLIQDFPEKKSLASSGPAMTAPLMVCDRRSDSLELVKFYNATGGPNWWKKWDLNKPISSWHGIELESGCVVSIDLEDTVENNVCCNGSGNNLTGPLISVNLPFLKFLDLGKNKLTGVIPNFDMFPNLEYLDLHLNKFSGTIPNFDKLPKLTIMDLGANELISPIPNFDKLSILNKLVLDENQFAGTIPNFDNLPNLNTLTISINSLTGSIPNFDKLLSLKTLGLVANQLTGTIPNFNNLPLLESLQLRINKLTGPIPNFDKLPNLVDITLDNNLLDGKIPEFDKLQSLERLGLGSNLLIGSLPAFSGCPKIIEIYAAENNLNGFLPDYTISHPALSSISLRNNKFSFSGLIKNANKVLIHTKKTVIGGSPDSLLYHPQQKIYSDTTITISSNSNYTLDLLIDDTVTTSTYAWYKNDIPYKTIKGSNKLPFSPFTGSDAGTYTVKITNPLAPQLTLESWPIRLLTSPSLVCDRRSDSLELVKFYNATAGSNWWKKWDLTKPIDMWWGIKLNPNGCVQVLQVSDTTMNGFTECCSGNNLIGTLPDINLPELEIFDSQNNQGITGPIPNFNFPSLKSLSIGNNKLTGSIPDFDKLPNLEYLGINYMQITGSIHDFDLPNLKSLEIHSNRLTDSIPNFTKLSNLENFQAYDNQLSGSIPNFNNLPLLKYLWLERNQLSDSIPNFNKIPLLQSLELGDNKLTRSIPDFDSLPNLTSLNLRNNLLVGQIPELERLPKLQELRLKFNKLTGPLPAFLKNPDLIDIDMADNNLSGYLPNYSIILPKLSSISFRNNKYSFSGIIQNIMVIQSHVKTLLYNPQQKIYSDTTINIPSCTDYTLDLKLDDTVTTSTYTWLRNGSPFMTNKGSNKLTFSGFNSADNGTYTVFITNPLAPQLTLESHPIRLVSSGTATNINNPRDTSLTCGLSFRLPVITGQNLGSDAAYFTGPGRTGTRYASGQLITSDATLYVHTTSGGCFDEDTFRIQFTNPVLLARPDTVRTQAVKPVSFDVLANDIIQAGLPTQVTIDNPANGSILYSTSTGRGTYTPDIGFVGTEVLNYTVCIVDCPASCKSPTLTIIVEGPCGDRNSLVLPNVIFPTGSGVNRYFIVEAITKCPDAWGPKPHKLEVFNRWGDEVYRNDNYLNDWDGTNTSGQPLPEGTYYYLLDLGSVAAPVRGYVVIMR